MKSVARQRRALGDWSWIIADAGMPGDIGASIVEMQALLLGTETIQEFLAELAGPGDPDGG